MSEHSYVIQEGNMKIAYIVDGSTDLKPSVKKLDNVHNIPFRGYVESGKLEEIKNIKTLKEYQSIDTKQYIEPTPGSYRELYKKLLDNGYDCVVVIPQHKDNSISYVNASYAARLVDNVLVIDASKYKITTEEILDGLLNDSIEDTTVFLGLDQLLDMIKGILNKLNPLHN